MKYTELTSLSDEQLVHKELALERELTAFRFRLFTNQLDDNSKLKKIRKDIARVQTAARARELAQGLAPNGLRDLHKSTFQAQALGGRQEGSSFLKGVVDKAGGNE